MENLPCDAVIPVKNKNIIGIVTWERSEFREWNRKFSKRQST